MNFANFIPAILSILGLSAFNKVDGKECLSSEERAALKGYGFSDQFLDDFNAFLQNPPAAATGSTPNQQMAAVAAVLGQTTEQLQARTAELNALKQTVATDAAAHAAAIQAKEAEIAALNTKIQTLSALPETDPGKGAGSATATAPAFNLADEQQLGGLSGSFFSLERPYNRPSRQRRQDAGRRRSLVGRLQGPSGRPRSVLPHKLERTPSVVPRRTPYNYQTVPHRSRTSGPRNPR